MTGLIWFVQIVHYPLMGSVGSDFFSAYESKHTFQTTLVVMPVMLLELFTGFALVFGRGSQFSLMGSLEISMILLGLIWASTFFLQVPLHQQLVNGFDTAAHQKLVNSNWIRTVLWSARAILLLFVVRTAASGSVFSQ